LYIVSQKKLTPKNAVLSQSDSVQCLICGAILLKTVDRIAVFGRSQWELTLNQNILYVCNRKCFPGLKKVEKMSSTLRNLENEQRAEFSGILSFASSAE